MTLIELMIAITILVIVMGLTIGAIVKNNKAVRDKQKAAAVTAVKNAIVAYRQYYRRWPGLPENFNQYENIVVGSDDTRHFKGAVFGGGDALSGLRYGANSLVLKALDPINTGPEENPNKRAFLDPSVVFVERSDGLTCTWKMAREGGKGITPDNGELNIITGPRTGPKQDLNYLIIVYDLDNDSAMVYTPESDAGKNVKRYIKK